MRNLKTLLFTLLMAVGMVAVAQNASVKGTLVDESTGQPLGNTPITAGGKTVMTDQKGDFVIDGIPAGQISITYGDSTYQKFSQDIFLRPGDNFQLGQIYLAKNEQISSNSNTPSVDLADLNMEGTSSVAGLLNASQDVFIQNTMFNFGNVFFRNRGYDFDNSTLFINGVPMNDLESGDFVWRLWGGLNDVFRGRQFSVGLEASDYTFGGFGGAQSVDVSASRQRKQIRASYAFSNNTYAHRAMLTWNSGMTKKGWAFSLSTSYRWGDGFIPGTFVNALAYFASIEKKINKNHDLTLTAWGVPTVQGRATSSFTPMYGYAEDNNYNPDWGYQNGEVRNSKVRNLHVPTVILNHDWKVGKKATLANAVLFQTGPNAQSTLDWYRAPDPRPDFYKRMPDYITTVDPNQALAVAEEFRNNVNARQINWDNMYNVNRNNTIPVLDASGSVVDTANRSLYILANQHSNATKFTFNSIYKTQATDMLSYQAGVTYQYFHGDNFQTVKDLLGGDYWLNVNQFNEILVNQTGNQDAAQNDMNEPRNTQKKVGDKYGYHYQSDIHHTNTWGQAQLNTKYFDFFGAVEAGMTSFFRTGMMRNGLFPNNSYGRGEGANFLNYGVKGGVTYKLNGRNYFYGNAAYITKAPDFRNAYVSVRTRDQLAPGLTTEKVSSFEAGFVHNSPLLKARLTGYYTYSKDMIQNRNFLLDNITEIGGSGFVNYIMTDVAKEYMGIEAAIEYKLSSSVRVFAAGAIGQHVYGNRPQVSIFLDNEPFTVADSRTAYIQNYRLSNGPQNVYTAGLSYNSKDFWFIRVNFNYIHKVFFDINPDRRTLEAISYNGGTPEVAQDAVPRGSELWHQILDQYEAPGAFYCNIFGGKSWKIGRNNFINLNVGVNNLFNNRNIVRMGFEQLRYRYDEKDVTRFPNEVQYAQGMTFFISLAYRY